LDALEQSLIVINMAESGYNGVVDIDYIVSDEGIFLVEIAVVLLARNLDQILYLKESLKEMGVKRDRESLLS